HPRPEEAVERFLRAVHDRLVLVEGDLEDDRHSAACDEYRTTGPPHALPPGRAPSFGDVIPSRRFSRFQAKAIRVPLLLFDLPKSIVSPFSIRLLLHVHEPNLLKRGGK